MDSDVASRAGLQAPDEFGQPTPSRDSNSYTTTLRTLSTSGWLAMLSRRFTQPKLITAAPRETQEAMRAVNQEWSSVR